MYPGAPLIFVLLHTNDPFIYRMAEESILIRKLDEFIRKYYRNRLIKGLLWTLSLLATYYLVLIIGEYYFHFSPAIRTVLFFAFLSGAIFLFSRLVFLPILQIIKIGRQISHVKAAEIIGNHFPEIQDKLLNTLQLIRKRKDPGEHADLLSASIKQKTESLKLFQFTKVIDFRKNMRYLRLAFIPIAIILVLALFLPGFITDPTIRIIQYNKSFAAPLPFKIEIRNKDLSVVQQQDFELSVVASGIEIPSEIYLRTKSRLFKMNKDRGFNYTFLFKSLQENTSFIITAGDFSSKSYEIKVFPKPTLLSFDVEVTYPSYLNKPAEKLENIGDLTIPEGTGLKWNFYTKDVSVLELRIGDKRNKLIRKQSNVFTFSESRLTTTSYCISPLNETKMAPDSLVYHISVISDGFPTIYVAETKDSLLNTRIFFKGTIKDDYGFTRLTFNADISSKDDSVKRDHVVENIMIDKRINNQEFFYMEDLQKLLPSTGMSLRYYFEVCDNDGIHGPKCSKSEVKTISTPTLEEITQRTEQNEKSMQDKINQSIKESSRIVKTVDELNKKMVEQNNISWQEKKKIEDLINANLEIEEKVKSAIRNSRENLENEEKYLNTSERIIQKQKQLEDMMAQLLSDEMKKMIEEMQEMLKQVDKAKLNLLLEKMKISNKELETQLDRNLALMKQLEFDRKLESLSQELKKMAEKLDNLAKETLGSQKTNEQLLEGQNRINIQADSLSAKLSELKTEGKTLETPADLGKTDEKADSIHKNLDSGKKKIEEKKTKEALKFQRNAAKQMRELSDQLEDLQQENEEDQLAEDASNIRMILENLIRLSFEQENLIGATRIISRGDPRLTEIIVSQKEFIQKLTIVEDSLNSVAKRQMALKPYISKEIAAIKTNIDMTLNALDSRNISLAVAKQQYSMTSINNLALLLNESLEKMDEQMASSMKSKGGKKSCPNPSTKGGKSSIKGIKELQEKLGQQLQKLKAGMESNSGKPGGEKSKKSEVNQQIAKLAAQQEAIRNQMQQYENESGAKGLKEQGNLNETKNEMEQLEKDLVNKRITQETIMRQQKILSRLLESDKAEQMRDQEEKRESTEAKNINSGNPNQYFQYNSKKKAGVDNIQLTLPVTSSFYKGKISSYILKIGY